MPGITVPLEAQIPRKKSNSPRAWQRMLSGRRLDLLDPSPVDIEIEDIAHGLARVARWNGQTIGDYAFSVAQHSLVVEAACRELSPGLSTEACMIALLHDSPEYVIGDMISPFKAVLGEGYRVFEDRLERAVHIRFGLPPVTDKKLKKLIKRADHISAWLEAVQLAGFSVSEANEIFGEPEVHSDMKLTPLPALEAQAQFVARFKVLLAEM
nr:HD family hydrolase [Ponticaulis sp.]